MWCCYTVGWLVGWIGVGALGFFAFLCVLRKDSNVLALASFAAAVEPRDWVSPCTLLPKNMFMLKWLPNCSFSSYVTPLPTNGWKSKSFKHLHKVFTILCQYFLLPPLSCNAQNQWINSWVYLNFFHRVFL